MVLYDLYIIYNEGGRCIDHYKFSGLNVNSDLVCPFLDALTTFAMETIPSQGRMRLLDRGDVKILFEQGTYVTLALFASENLPETRGLLLLFLSKFERDYANILRNWDGSLHAFSGLEDLVRSIFRREKASQDLIPADLMPKPIPLFEVAGSWIRAQDALAVIRTAVQNGVSGVLSIALDSSRFDPMGYLSILGGKGYAAVYTKPGSNVRRGSDAVRHMIFDSLTLPAMIKFRVAEDSEVESEIDSATNRIDAPLYRISLDVLILRHRYDEIRSLKIESKRLFSPEEVQDIHNRFGDAAISVLRTVRGNVTLEQLAIVHGLSSLEVTEILAWAIEKGLAETLKS